MDEQLVSLAVELNYGFTSFSLIISVALDKMFNFSLLCLLICKLRILGPDSLSLGINLEHLSHLAYFCCNNL